MRTSTRSAFTLIEVLIVLAVMAILASMAMPVLGVAQRAAKRTATEAVMRRCEVGLRLFHQETGSYPYQLAYADVDAGERPDNRLAWHLATDLSPADQLDLQADAEAAAAAYTFDCTPPGGSGDAVEPTGTPKLGALAFRSADVTPGTSLALWRRANINLPWTLDGDFSNGAARLATAVTLNRMARERARRAVYAGNLELRGSVVRDSRDPQGNLHQAGVDRSNTKVLTTARTAGRPGWANDYLAGDLDPKYRDGETILDAFGRPLVYVGQVVEGMRARGGVIFGVPTLPILSRDYGLDRQGRRVLHGVDPETGAALSADADTLPDPANLRHSDRRTWAAPGFEDEFELWSTGPDGRWGWMRDDLRNQDNIALLPYDREL